MGTHKNININKYPKQSWRLKAKVKLYFHYDTSKSLNGEIVREDTEEPFLMIIKSETGKFYLATECQYSFCK